MGTMSVPRKTPCPTQKGCKRGNLFFSHKESTGAKGVVMETIWQVSFCFFVMCITGAKFEDPCSNISGDILNSVFYRFSGTIYDVITSLICIIQKPEYL